MDKPLRVSSPIYTFFPTEVEGFNSLAELALDMHLYWNHSADEVWRELDPALWKLTYNPWVVLQTISRDQLQRALGEPVFRNKVDELLRNKRREEDSPAWFQQNHGQSPLTGVAYFSMEFMLSEALPIYSGGLGNVAGDQLKTASDLGVPVFGVGLLYQQGYFRQVIDQEGAQQALYPYNDPGQLPIRPLRGTKRGVAAAGTDPARLLGLAAGLAGSGRPGETVSARQQRSGQFSGPAGDHQRAVRRRPGVAAQSRAGPRHRRLAPAECPRPSAGSLPSE